MPSGHRPSAVPYQPASERSLRPSFAALTNLLGAALPLCSFIDMGCGMGKVLLLAAESPLRQVIGGNLPRSSLPSAKRISDKTKRRFIAVAYQDFVVYHNAQHVRLLQKAEFCQVWENGENRILK